MLVGVPQRCRADKVHMYLYVEKEIYYKEFARTIMKASHKFCGVSLQWVFIELRARDCEKCWGVRGQQ